MNLIDLIGHLGYLSLVVGQFFITRKRADGFIFRILGSSIWAILGWILGLSSIVIWSIIFAGVDIYGFWRWVKDENK